LATTAAGSGYVVTPSLATGTGGFLESNYQVTYNPYNGTVNAYQTTTSITALPTPLQYSDKITLTARIIGGAPLVTGGPQAAQSVTFNIGGQVMNSTPVALAPDGADLVASLQVALLETTSGSMAPQIGKSVSATYNSTNSNYALNNNPVSTSINVNQEDATVSYTGDEIKSTGSATSSSVTVNLRALVKDITVTDPLDPNPGDITKAKVRFIVTNVSGTTVYTSGWISPSLVNTSDLTIGSASSSFPATISGTDDEFTVRVLVGKDGADYQGYYIATEDKAVVTVYQPIGDFITGGGYLVNTQSQGSMNADYNSKTNFGFNVHFNKKGTNLQGHMNIVFRRTVGSTVRSYQVKANSMVSLGVDATDPNNQKAEYVSKVNLTDITDPSNPVPVGSGVYYLFVKMVDKGEPGINDLISFAVVTGSGNTPNDPTVLSNIVYSSNWVSGQTQMMTLAGGNLVVHSGFNLGTASSTITRINTQSIDVPVQLSLKLRAFPNPTSSQFFVNIQSNNSVDPIQLHVFDLYGRTLESRQQVAAGSSVQLGSNYKAGIYFIEVMQGDQKQQLKLIKQ
jgi:hypothetical protein